MEEERNTEGWSARQLIKQLNGSAGNRQQAVGSSQSPAGNRQSAVGSSQSPAGNRQSAVGSSHFETTSSVGQPVAGQANTEQGSSHADRPKAPGKKSNGGVFKGLISGTLISESLILKDLRYTALIAFLGIIFIANKFNAEKMERQIIVLEQEVRDMRAESLSVSAELGGVSRQSEITELVKERGLGLEELREPPYRIVVNE